ncbi:hypothetical protein [Ilumatobacter nonamiensis]|uniref:hypothetical protein n=1 Tax=Ilumatobacter nonamiensis TaxID=467093 RepID=UPI0003477B6A|nr:hypothetical protein [Ilumatobacter nonamiensis]
MFTTGTKFLIGASVVSLLATLIYGIGQDGVLGTVGLASATVGLIFLTSVNAILRDSNVFLDDEAPVESTAAAQPAPGASVWPLVFALGTVVVAVGLITYQPVVVIGLIALVVAGGEWAVQAWSERASSSGEHNAEVRSRVSNPLEYPVGGAVAVGIIIYSFSRVMLWLSKTNTVIAFGALAAVVVVVAFALARRPKLNAGAVGGGMAIGVVALVAAGAVTGADGERDIPEFETTSIWQEEAILHPEEYAEGAAEGHHPEGLICESPEAFPEADENASETVAIKSSIYEVVLNDSGTLDYDVPGVVGTSTAVMSLPRSNPTNVIFRNDSDEERRLSLDVGTMTVEIEHGEEVEEVEARNQICTTLIEPGGAQLLTFRVDEPTFAFDGQPNPNGPDDAEGFWFFVPGVDSAVLEVYVP